MHTQLLSISTRQEKNTTVLELPTHGDVVVMARVNYLDNPGEVDKRIVATQSKGDRAFVLNFFNDMPVLYNPHE